MENTEEKRMSRSGMLLLSETNFDFRKLDMDLKEHWGIEIEFKNEDVEKGVVVSNVGDFLVSFMYLDIPVPNDEAVEAASRNFPWREAVATAKLHKAHMLVYVSGGNDPYELGRLYSKIMGECCNQENAIGVYQLGTVFHSKAFRDISHLLKKYPEEIPYYNLVFVGMYRSMHGTCGYTSGLNLLGKDEIEIIDSKKDPKVMYEFLDNIVQYVVFNDVTLKDGETIGASAEERIQITRSESVVDEGMSLKLAY